MALILIEHGPGKAPSIQEMMTERSAVRVADMMIQSGRIYRVRVYVRDETYADQFHCTHTAEAPEPVQGGGVPG